MRMPLGVVGGLPEVGGQGILPAALRANPPDIFFNFKTNKAQYKNGTIVAADSALTFSRASVAYGVDTSGNWTQFASGVPVITNKGLQPWEARTNGILNSNVPTAGGGWTLENCTTTLQVGQGPGSGLDAYLYDNLTGGPASHRLLCGANLSYTNGTTYTLSTYVKYVNAQFVQVMFPSATFGATAYANFDLINNTVATAGAGTTASISTYANGWVRLDITAAATATIGSQSAGLQVCTTGAAARSESYTGSNGRFLFWNMQSETGAYSTSPIISAGSAFARLQDTVLVNMTGIAAIGSAYSLYGRATVDRNVITQFGVASFDDNTSNNRTPIRYSGSGQLLSVSGGVATTMTNGIWNAGVSVKIAGAIAAGDQREAFNGTLSTAGTGALPVGVNNLRIGCAAPPNGQLFAGFIEEIAFWTTQRVSDSFLQSITT